MSSDFLPISLVFSSRVIHGQWTHHHLIHHSLKMNLHFLVEHHFHLCLVYLADDLFIDLSNQFHLPVSVVLLWKCTTCTPFSPCWYAPPICTVCYVRCKKSSTYIRKQCHSRVYRHAFMSFHIFTTNVPQGTSCYISFENVFRNSAKRNGLKTNPCLTLTVNYSLLSSSLNCFAQTSSRVSVIVAASRTIILLLSVLNEHKVEIFFHFYLYCSTRSHTLNIAYFVYLPGMKPKCHQFKLHVSVYNRSSSYIASRCEDVANLNFTSKSAIDCPLP